MRQTPEEMYNTYFELMQLDCPEIWEDQQTEHKRAFMAGALQTVAYLFHELPEEGPQRAREGLEVFKAQLKDWWLADQQKLKEVLRSQHK